MQFNYVGAVVDTPLKRWGVSHVLDRRKLSRRDSNLATTTRAPRFSKFFVIVANIEIWLAETEPYEITGFRIDAR
jgi:hypothetical protein